MLLGLGERGLRTGRRLHLREVRGERIEVSVGDAGAFEVLHRDLDVFLHALVLPEPTKGRFTTHTSREQNGLARSLGCGPHEAVIAPVGMAARAGAPVTGDLRVTALVEELPS